MLFLHALLLFALSKVLASEDYKLTYDALRKVKRDGIVDTKLKPDVHPDTDTSDIQHLRPQERVKFFYTTDDPGNFVGGSLDLKLNFSTVPLEHSDAVKSVQCDDNDIQINLNTKEAYDYIAQTWPSNGSEFILAGYYQGCAGYSDGVRSFSVVKSFQMLENSLSVHASVKNMDVESVVQEFYFEWGIKVPQSNDSTLVRRSSTQGSQTINVTAQPSASSLVSSAFGPAFPLYSSKNVSVVCVDCRAYGVMKLTGSIGWSIFNPLALFAGDLTLAGNLSMAVELGINATVGNTSPSSRRLETRAVPSFSQVLYAQALLGISLPGLITIAPMVAAAASSQLLVDGPGSMIAGGTFNWPNFSLTVNLLSENSQSAGFIPNFSPLIKSSGQYGVTINPGLPTAIGLELIILNGLYSNTIYVTQSAAISLDADTQGIVGLVTRDLKYQGEDLMNETVYNDMMALEQRQVQSSRTSSSSVRSSISSTSSSSSSRIISSPNNSNTPTPSSSRSISSSTTSTRPSSTSASAPASCSPGISLTLNLANNVILSVFGNRRSILNSYDSPSLSKCITT